MAPNLNRLLSGALIIILSVILYFPATASSQDCPYPCYPPPTGPGTTTPETPPSSTIPPPPPSQTLPYNPPPPAFYQPPTSGSFPYSPPFVGTSPSPPDPMVPWFPYYYRKPPHQSDESSAHEAVAAHGVSAIMFAIVVTYMTSLL